MGYDTRYTISSVSVRGGARLDRLRQAFNRYAAAATNGYPWFGVAIRSSPMKWYEHEEHIAQAMMEADVERLTLHGEGSEHGDIWDKEFELSSGPEDQIVQKAVTIRTFKYELVRKQVDGEATIIRGKAG